MKKLLILVLVLGVASTAHATLTPITSWVDGVCTWTLDQTAGKLIGTGTTATAYVGPWLSPSLGTITPEVAVPASDPWKAGLYRAAGDAGIIGLSAGLVQATAADNLTDLPDLAIGQWFGFDLTGDSNGEVQIQQWTGSEYETILQGIPEPVTLVLLGLGGLLLRRRK